MYLESDEEVLFGSLNGGPDGTFTTTYKFEAKLNPEGSEIRGRCQHQIVAESGPAASRVLPDGSISKTSSERRPLRTTTEVTSASHSIQWPAETPRLADDPDTRVGQLSVIDPEIVSARRQSASRA